MHKTAIHIYQRTENGFLLFYSATDFLCFFTIICSAARKYGVRVLGICPMFDHLHALAEAFSRENIVRFVQRYSSLYALELNEALETSGPVFSTPFGSAVKRGDKAIRTCCSYVYNNPCEKHLCDKAEEYRWNFLAYAASNHPFSEKLRREAASARLRSAIKMVDYHFRHSEYLKRKWIAAFFSRLNDKEKNQLSDYIICKYNCIDYPALLSYYGDSYDQACLAFASNQGSEYDIQEEFHPESHKAYLEIPALLLRRFGFDSVYDALRLPRKDKELLYRQLLCSGKFFTRRQLLKYLRLPDR